MMIILQKLAGLGEIYINDAFHVLTESKHLYIKLQSILKILMQGL